MRADRRYPAAGTRGITYARGGIRNALLTPPNPPPLLVSCPSGSPPSMCPGAVWAALVRLVSGSKFVQRQRPRRRGDRLVGRGPCWRHRQRTDRGRPTQVGGHPTAQTRRTQRAAQRAHRPDPVLRRGFHGLSRRRSKALQHRAQGAGHRHTRVGHRHVVVEHRHDVAERRQMRRDGFPEFTQLVERPDAFRGLGQLLQRRCRWPPRPRRPAQGARRGW